jgi:hypothetical protein
MPNPDEAFVEFVQGIKDNCDNKRLKDYGWPYEEEGDESDK